MAYVPGYQYDVFISYAHGDDRDWINRLLDQLRLRLKHKLGIAPDIWIDEDALRESRDFSREIPDSVRSSAVFLLLPSPTYIRSQYCIHECEVFKGTIPGRRSRFGAAFANELFALSCPMHPVDNDEHRSIFPGLTDIAFCDDSDTFQIDSPEFEPTLRRLVGALVGLLKRLRNQSTAVFLYPSHPGSELQAAHKALVAELSAQSYRILPDRNVNLPDQIREASLSVFLLGTNYEDDAKELAEIAAARKDMPWVVWRSPAADQTASPEQAGFCAYLEQLDSATKTYLDPGIVAAKLKEEVFSLLRPDPRAIPKGEGKPRVYLIYNSRDHAEVRNAGLISLYFKKDIHFDHPNDPGQHTIRLSCSDGVLLVWGNADEEWCSREFAEMVQSARTSKARGLCVFDPAENKTLVVQQIRSAFNDLYVSEEYGKFDPARLETFFNPLLRLPAEPHP